MPKLRFLWVHQTQFLPAVSFNPTKRQIWTWFLEGSLQSRCPEHTYHLLTTTGCIQDGSHSCPELMRTWQLPVTLCSCPVKWWVTEDLGSCTLQSPCLTVQSFHRFYRKKSHRTGTGAPWGALGECLRARQPQRHPQVPKRSGGVQKPLSAHHSCLADSKAEHGMSLCAVQHVHRIWKL